MIEMRMRVKMIFIPDVEHAAEKGESRVRTDRLPDAPELVLPGAVDEAVALPMMLNNAPVAHAVALASASILNI